jgi:hypothetical protein
MLTDLKRKFTPYYIDIFNCEYASGWCFHRIFRNTPPVISFRQAGKIMGEARCGLLRQDLKDQGLHPTGYCGFECVFHEPLDHQSGDPVSVHINGSNWSAFTYGPDQVLDVFKPDGNPIFFMHIPKTAGTSFNNYIRQYFGYQMSHTHIQTTPLERQREMANTSHFLSGHVTLEHIPSIFNDRRNVHRHSIVRQPLKQLHSHIGWVKGIALDPNGDFFQKHHSLVQDMGKDLFRTDLANPKNLRQLAAGLDGFQIDFFDNIQTRYFLDYRPDRVSERDCHNAISNISQFKTIGLTESFNQYTGEFCDFYGITQKPVTSVHNPSKVKPLFDINDPASRAAIEPLVQYDIALYDEIARQKNS